MDLSILTQTLVEYSKKALERSDLVLGALTPLALVLAGVFFLIEFEKFQRQFSMNGGTLNSKIFFQHFWKYFICFIMIYNAALIFDVIFAVGLGALKMVDAVVPKQTFEIAVELGKVKGTMKILLGFIGWMIEGFAQLSIKLIVLMRNLYLYIFRAVSPLMMAFFMSETTRQITINFLKKVGAVAFQGVLILVVVRIFPALVTSDLLKVDFSSKSQLTGAVFSSIAKSVLFIIIIWSTERKAKELLNAM